MTDDLAALRAELERHRINMTITGGYAVSLLADTVDRIISALARAEAAERERDDALAEAASLHGAECIENAALRSLAEAAEREAERLRAGIVQARAFCLNWMPDDVSPMRQQFNKMVGELTALLAAQPGAAPATGGER